MNTKQAIVRDLRSVVFVKGFQELAYAQILFINSLSTLATVCRRFDIPSTLDIACGLRQHSVTVFCDNLLWYCSVILCGLCAIPHSGLSESSPTSGHDDGWPFNSAMEFR